jgi:hypothetical protein
MNARKFWTAALCACVAACSSIAATGNLPDGAYRVQRARIVDPNGFGQPMTAFTLLVPAGWSTSGGIVWQVNQQGCGKAGTHIAWRAVSPDGISAIELMPEESWGGNNLQLPPMQLPCPNVGITTVQEYLRWLVERTRPGARILDFRDRSDAIKALEGWNSVTPSVGGEIRNWVQAGEVLLAYNFNGQDVREMIGITVLFSLSRMQGVVPGEIREFLTISARPAIAMRAPHGQLDFNLAEALRLSIKSDPEWTALMNEHNRKMSGISAKGAADRHAIRMDTAREIEAMRNQGVADRQASLDRSHGDFVNVIRGVENFIDTTSNERIELPNNYQHAWRLKDDTYILTDDPNFDPNRDLKLEAHELKPERR